MKVGGDGLYNYATSMKVSTTRDRSLVKKNSVCVNWFGWVENICIEEDSQVPKLWILRIGMFLFRLLTLVFHERMSRNGI